MLCETLADVVGPSGLQVDEPRGPRWELALSLMESGEAPIVVGSVGLSRDTSGPHADGLIRVVVRSATEVLTTGDARAQVNAAKATMQAVDAADPRFGDLLDRYGCRWELVYDYGMGTVLLADIDDEGNLDWRPGREPA